MPIQKTQIPKLRYFGYAALFWAKKAAGLRAHRHRNFLIWKWVKLIESGKIDPQKISITSMGKTDGAGAQAMAKFSAMCFAQAYGMRYVHAPFSNLAHAELNGGQWDQAWEDLLRMGSGNVQLDPTSMLVVGAGEFLENPALWNREVVVFERHYHAFCELAPLHGLEVSKKLQAAYLRGNPSRDSSASFRIGVHVRRGDVRQGDVETKHRYTPNTHIISILEQVLKAVTHAGHTPEIHVHTNGGIDELAEFNRFAGIHYHAGSPALDTFVSLAASDILIGTRSDFSTLAGIYCRGIVICDPRHRTPLPEWIRASGDLPAIGRDVSRRLKKPSDLDATGIANPQTTTTP